MTSSIRYRGRVVVILTETTIQAFDEPAHDSLFTDQSIRDWQIDACTKAKFEYLEASNVQEAENLLTQDSKGPSILMLDRHYISEKALKDFAKAGTGVSEEIVSLGLSSNCSVDYTLPLQTVRHINSLIVHDIFLFKTKPTATKASKLEQWLDELHLQATPVEVPKREIVFDIPLPTIGEGQRQVLKYPVTSSIVVSIEHWVHILWLNQLAFGIWLAETLRKRPLWILWKTITAFSFNIDVIFF